MTDWQPARTVYELQDIIVQMPPPTTNSFSNQNYGNKPSIPPKTWLVESILVTLFCCLPFGIIGIINASKVESRFYAGDYSVAEQASRDARKWTMLGLWIGLAVSILYIISVFVLGINDAFY